MQHFDLVIVGGGLAGASLAVALRVAPVPVHRVEVDQVGENEPVAVALDRRDGLVHAVHVARGVHAVVQPLAAVMAASRWSGSLSEPATPNNSSRLARSRSGPSDRARLMAATISSAWSATISLSRCRGVIGFVGMARSRKKTAHPGGLEVGG